MTRDLKCDDCDYLDDLNTVVLTCAHMDNNHVKALTVITAITQPRINKQVVVGEV